MFSFCGPAAHSEQHCRPSGFSTHVICRWEGGVSSQFSAHRAHIFLNIKVQESRII